MPYVTLPGGITAHVKLARRPQRRCCSCSAVSGFQCDYQVAPGRTCDAHICATHAAVVGPDVRHCPQHAGVQRGLFTELLS